MNVVPVMVRPATWLVDDVRMADVRRWRTEQSVIATLVTGKVAASETSMPRDVWPLKLTRVIWVLLLAALWNAMPTVHRSGCVKSRNTMLFVRTENAVRRRRAG